MITVTVIETGDCVDELETPEDAVYAARTIGREAKEHRGVQGFDPTIQFDVAGKMVRVASLRSLMR